MPSDSGGFTATTQLVRDDRGLRLHTRKVRVEVAAGPEGHRVEELPGPTVRIGSSPGCDLVLRDPAVSRHHLTIRLDERGVRIVDEGSRNGTAVDGLLVRDVYARPDSSIALGDTTLRLRLLADEIVLPLSDRERFGALLGRSAGMRRVFALLERVAATDATLLVTGETGTGKELVAEAVHEESPRADGPFVVVDCSAVSPTLIESELFGHVKGAFTGAVGSRPGAFEVASGGTLFLDEIGELPLDLQPKLLRALESREVRRVGSNAPTKVDVRIIAATNRALEAEVEKGTFREDLYFRLAVVSVVLPPLRERPEDIPLLVENFTRAFARGGGEVEPLADSAVVSFQAKSWPGNVRELRNAVERALSLGVVAGADSDEPPIPASLPVDLEVPLQDARQRLLEAFERAYLEAALARTGNNVSRAARIAGVSRRFIQRAMKRWREREEP